jgi:hypothetical protein
VSGDAVALRDRVVLWVLAGGAGLALLSWHLVGPWAAMVVLVLALVAAAVAYRIEPPRIDLNGSPTWTDRPSAHEAVRDERVEPVDQ